MHSLSTVAVRPNMNLLETLCRCVYFYVFISVHIQINTHAYIISIYACQMSLAQAPRKYLINTNLYALAIHHQINRPPQTS